MKTHQDVLQEFSKAKEFIPPYSTSLWRYEPVIEAIYEQIYTIHSVARAGEAFTPFCQQACFSMIEAISTQSVGSYPLESIRVCEGFVGDTPHLWLVLGMDYYIDIPIVHGKEKNIPPLVILPVQTATTYYRVTNCMAWNEWLMKQVDIEIN